MIATRPPATPIIIGTLPKPPAPGDRVTGLEGAMVVKFWDGEVIPHELGEVEVADVLTHTGSVSAGVVELTTEIEKLRS